MIKIFSKNSENELEKSVNKWIEDCGCNIDNIQFSTDIDADGVIVYSCCIVTELNLY